MLTIWRSRKQQMMIIIIIAVHFKKSSSIKKPGLNLETVMLNT